VTDDEECTDFPLIEVAKAGLIESIIRYESWCGEDWSTMTAMRVVVRIGSMVHRHPASDDGRVIVSLSYLDYKAFWLRIKTRSVATVDDSSSFTFYLEF
jgi:hypothetical protein